MENCFESDLAEIRHEPKLLAPGKTSRAVESISINARYSDAGSNITSPHTTEDYDLLKQQLEEKSRELTIANDQLRARNAEYQQFVSVVSHDLKAPLRAIAGFSEFLREEYQDRLDDNSNDYIERILDGVVKMRRLIGGLAEYARVEAREPLFEVTNLSECVVAALDGIDDSIRRTKTVVTHEEFPLVKASKTELTQLLAHLFVNSIKFCGVESPKIHVSARVVDDECIVTVSDNGIGIERSECERVFELFLRLQRKEDVEGIGVGMAVCRRIIGRHFGRIWVEATPRDIGTSVCFTIPIAGPGENQHDRQGNSGSLATSDLGN